MRTRSKMSRTAVLGAVVAALLALPAAASASPSWLESDGQPLGTQSGNGATGFDDRVTASVSGTLNFDQSFWPTGLHVSCDVTGAIELWNDGPGLAAAKNRIVGLDASDCDGGAGMCNFTDFSASNLPWSGSVGPVGSGHPAAFSGVNIAWTTTGGCGGSGFTTTGTLDTWAYVSSCEAYGHEGYGIEDTLSNAIGSISVSGELLVDSIAGLYEPGGCVTLSDV